MRALLVLLLLSGCDRVFGLGDPYEDAAGAHADSPRPTGDTSSDAASQATLLAYYPLDGNLDDMTGRGAATCQSNTGACTYLAPHGGSGQSLEMTGLTCLSFQLPDQPPSVSIALWAYPNNGATETLVVRPYETTAAPASWRVDEDNDSIAWTTFDGAMADVVTGGGAGAFAQGAWHHLAVTASAAKHEIYVDGLALTSGQQGASVKYTSDGSTVYIGCEAPGGTGANFFGAVDEVRVYSGVLSPVDIAALAQ